MLYLIESFMRGDNDHPLRCLKIGYAKDVEDRLKTYKTHNPSVKLLKTREGDYELENYLHKYFKRYELPGYQEWFIYSKDLIVGFESIDIQEETIAKEEYLEYVRKEILKMISKTYESLFTKIPELLDELEREFSINSYKEYIYSEFPKDFCEGRIKFILSTLEKKEIDYFSSIDFSNLQINLPQIVSKQRLKENVFRDECIFIYKLADNTITMELFEDLRDKKIATSLEDLKNFEGVVKTNPTGKARFLEFIRQNVKNNRYTSDYTGINETLGVPMINKLVMLSERRAFELRSDVYKNEVSVYNEFANISEDNIVTDTENQIKYCLDQLKLICSERGSFEEKMREVCNVLFMYPDKIFISDLDFLPRDWKNYLISLGPERIKALGYIESNLKKELLVYLSSDILKKQFRETFEVGKRYTLKYLKESIGLIYQDNSVPKTPKAIDLEKYFDLKKCSIYDNGKKVNGYEILGLK